MTHEQILSMVEALTVEAQTHRTAAQQQLHIDPVYTSRMAAALVCSSLAQTLLSLVAHEKSLSA